tara:strand:+ start:22 stop:216 length:195 start_codon:yes stop_codon:yes gene_type:complete
MKEENPTYPVILVGVDKKESLGFQKLRVIQEDSEGLHVSELHLKGIVSVQMINETLVVFVKESR